MNGWLRTMLMSAAAIIALLASGCGKKEIPDGTVVTLVYSTDVHGKLEGCGCKHGGGGVTHRSAAVAKVLTQDPDAVYCDAGNFMTGTPEVDSTHGLLSIAIYNQMKASVVSLSERELAFGMDNFRKAKEQAKFAMVSANLRYKGSAFVEAYTIKQVKEAKVAFIGLCGTKEVMRTDSSLLPADFSVDDPIVAARRAVASLRGKVNVMVLLSTCGDEMDSALATNFSDLDVIIGGRSYRPNPANPWLIGKTRIMRNVRDGRELGKIDLSFGPGNAIKMYNPVELALDTGSPSDDKMLALIKQSVPNFIDNPTEGVRVSSASK
jgi:5'-nucleotidase / UDP-sugar diphosphatase